MSWLIIAKVTLVFALARLALTLMRRTSAALRHVVIVIALSASLLIPGFEVALPSWEVLPRPAVSLSNAILQQSSVAVRPNPPTAPASPSPNVPVGADSRPWLYGLWLIGLAAYLVLLCASFAAIQIAARRARPLRDRSWDVLLTETCTALGIRERVQLRLRLEGTMPAVWGFLRPVVLLPEDCRSWSEARRRDVLAHELAHVARRDVLLLTLAHIACAVHWFNPLAWVLKKRLAVESEHACDDLALAQGTPASRYADHLLITAAQYRKRPSLAPVMAARSQLEERIVAILDTDRNHSRASRRAQLAIIAIAAAALVPLSSLAWAQSGNIWVGAHAHDHAHAHAHSAQFADHLRAQGIDRGDVDALIAGLGASDALTRAASAWALGDIDDSRVIDPLIQAGYDTDAVVRQWAVRSLASWDAPRIAYMLIDRLQDGDAEVRQWGVRTLERHDTAITTQPLIDTLGDADAEVREWAVRVLGDADDGRVTSALVDRMAVESNGAVSEWLVRSVADGDDSQNVEALMGALHSESAEVRQWAARGLAGVRDDRAVDALITTLRDRDDEVREWSARALGVCGNERAVAPLEAMSGDPSEDVREWAGRALEAIGC